MLKAIKAVLIMDMQIGFRRQSHIWIVFSFFLLCSMFFPFAVGSEPALLKKTGAGFFTLSALLSMMSSLSYMFANDHNDGLLEQLVSSDGDMIAYSFGRNISFWLMTIIPLILSAPISLAILGLDFSHFGMTVIILVLTTLSLTFIGSIGSAMVLTSNNAAMLLPLIVIPLIIPVLIFSANGLYMCYNGYDIQGLILILTAIALVSIVISPLITSYTLKVAVSR